LKAKGVAPSLELNLKMGKAGILAAIVTSSPTVQSLGFTHLPGGVDPADFDEFHELIISEEFKRIGCYGLADGLLGGFSIGPVRVFILSRMPLVSTQACSLEALACV
jgi:hypothetical protein